MMNKTQLLADLDTRVVRTITVTQESDPVKEGKGINSYVANTLYHDSKGRVVGRNIGFYVVDEGTETEAAYYRDDVGSKVSLHEETMAFVAALPFVKVQVLEFDETQEFVIARAWEDVDGKLTEKKIMLYKENGVTPTYKELTN